MSALFVSNLLCFLRSAADRKRICILFESLCWYRKGREWIGKNMWVNRIKEHPLA